MALQAFPKWKDYPHTPVFSQEWQMQDLQDTELGRMYGEWRRESKKLEERRVGRGCDAIYTKEYSESNVKLFLRYHSNEAAS
jgi:hypothetical protein